MNFSSRKTWMVSAWSRFCQPHGVLMYTARTAWSLTRDVKEAEIDWSLTNGRFCTHLSPHGSCSCWILVVDFEPCIFKMFFISKNWPSGSPEMMQLRSRRSWWCSLSPGLLGLVICVTCFWILLSPHRAAECVHAVMLLPGPQESVSSWSLGGAQLGGSVLTVTPRFHNICSILEFGVWDELVFYPSLWLCGTLKINSQDYYFLHFIAVS